VAEGDHRDGFWRILLTEDDGNRFWDIYRIVPLLAALLFLGFSTAGMIVYLDLTLAAHAINKGAFEFRAFASGFGELLTSVGGGFAALIGGSGIGLFLKGKSGS
jgi:hypothetical protein